MACCHWGTWWMMPKSTTVSWLAPGCWMSQTSPSRKRHSAPVPASARELDHGLVEVDRRHPSPTGTTCNSVSTTCAAISAAHRGLSNATTTTTTSASKLTALKGQKTATSRGTSWSSTSTRKPSSWAAHLRQAARARTHRRGRRGRSDGRQRPDDVVVELNYPEHQHRVWPMQILISRNLLHNNSFRDLRCHTRKGEIGGAGWLNASDRQPQENWPRGNKVPRVIRGTHPNRLHAHRRVGGSACGSRPGRGNHHPRRS